MNAERDLLFGVLAVQLGFAQPTQVMAAAGAWAADRTSGLPDHLMAFGDLSAERRIMLDGLVDQALSLHDGDGSKTLDTFGGQRIIDQTFGGSVVLEAGEVIVEPPERPEADQATAGQDDLDVTPEARGRYQPRTFEDDQGRTQSEIGRGGIGRVILALDGHLGREVAVKELLPGRSNAAVQPSETPAEANSLSTAMVRFLREARITGQLEHPNIVPVYELGQRRDGTIYYTMKIVRGRTMAEALADCETLADRLELLPHFVDLGQAVAYAHSRGVVHRDLKPENVMLGEFGETVVLDWGLAKTRDHDDPRAQEIKRELDVLLDATGSQTVAGTALGTPKYMSPEQAEGDLERIDERSDVWSLGAVLFEILTGRPAFDGLTAFEVLGQVIRGQVPAVADICPGAPTELAAVCRKAMQRKRRLRYPGAAELAREVTAFLTGGRVQAHEYQIGELLGRFARKHKVPLAITLVAALLLAGLGVWNHLRVVDERNRAVEAEAEARDRLGDSLREGARAAWVHQDLPEARARLRTALQLADSLAGRGLWQQLADSRLVWRAHFGALAYGLDFSPDGSRLAVAANDGQVYLVDPVSASADALYGTGPQFLAVAFSPDGHTLAGGVNGGPVHLWDLRAGTSRRLLDQHEGVKDLAFSPDGTRLATGSWEGTVRLWDLASGDQIAMASLKSWVSGLAFDGDGRRLYAGCAAGGVEVLDGASLKAQRSLETQGSIGYIALRPDGKSLAAASDDDGRITVFDLAGQTAPRTIPTPAIKIGMLAYPDRLVIGDRNRIRFLDAEQGRVLMTLEGHAGPVQALAYHPASQQLASGATDVRLWHLQGGQAQRGHRRNMLRLAFGPDGRRLYSTSQDQTLRVWDTATGAELRALKMGAAGGLAFHPKGDWLVTTHIAPKLWDPETLAVQAQLQLQTGNTEIVTVDPDGTRLAFAVRDQVHVFDARTRKSVRQVTCAEDTAALDLEGKGLLCAAQKGAGEVIVRDLTPGVDRTVSLRGHKGWVWSMAFSAHGTRLVTGGNDGTARVWELPSGRALHQVRHEEPIRSAILHPRLPLLATASNDHTVRVWDLETGREKWRWRLWTSPEVLAFDRSGQQLAVANLETLRLFDVDTGQAVWRGSSLLTRVDGPPLFITGGGAKDELPQKGWVDDLGRARLGRLSRSEGTACAVHGSAARPGDELAMWDAQADRPLWSKQFGHLREVVALPGACAVLEVEHPRKFGRVLLVDEAGKVTELAADATALGPHLDGLLLASGDAVSEVSLTGQVRGRTLVTGGLRLRKLPDPVVDRKDVLGREPTALVRIGDALIWGDAHGKLQRVSFGDGAPGDGHLVFGDSFPAATQILHPGPPGTVAAGFVDGHLGLWDLETGVRLASAKAHGPIRHLALHGDRLHGLTEVGDRITLDLSGFQRPWCDLLAEIWTQVPMEWHAGQAVRSPTPTDHPCNTPAPGHAPAP